MKAANFQGQDYCTREPVATAALRITHLATRHGLTIERAAMVAPMIFGEGAQ